MSNPGALEFYVQPSPAGGYHVMLRDAEAALSHHDTEAEAQERRDAYARGTHAWAVAELGRDVGRGERVVLRDGSQVRIRPIVAQDKPLFVAGFARLGEEARRRRFFSAKKQLTADELVRFTELDHHDAEALGAIDSATGIGVGVARYQRLRSGSDRAEAAVTVVDAWQGRGLGSELLARLARRALQQGVAYFCASVMVDNHAMRRAFERLGTVRLTSGGGGVLELEIELPVVELAETGFTGVTRALEELGAQDSVPETPGRSGGPAPGL
jgi:RimJ/RimL family protein N-acetyltransferase